MTEEEAKKKWCPYAFAARANGVAVFNESKCVASHCMMWREYLTSSLPGISEEQPDGYCGLAGKPDDGNCYTIYGPI